MVSRMDLQELGVWLEGLPSKMPPRLNGRGEPGFMFGRGSAECKLREL